MMIATGGSGPELTAPTLFPDWCAEVTVFDRLNPPMQDPRRIGVLR